MDIENKVKKCTGLILDLYMNGFYMDIEISTVKKGHIADIGYLHDRFSMDNRLHTPGLSGGGYSIN